VGVTPPPPPYGGIPPQGHRLTLPDY